MVVSPGCVFLARIDIVDIRGKLPAIDCQFGTNQICEKACEPAQHARFEDGEERLAMAQRLL